MDISEILALLESENTQKAIAQDNPYIGALSIPQAIDIPEGKYSTGESIVGNLVKGLLGGAGTTMAQNYQDKLKDEYGAAILSKMLGVEAQPNRLSKSIFKNASDLGTIFKVQNAEESAQKEQTLEDQFQLKRQGKIAEIVGEDEAYRMLDEMTSGEEPIATSAKELSGAKESGSAKQSTSSLLSPRGKEEFKRKQDIEGAYETFSKGVRSSEEFANYRDRVEAVRGLASAFSDPSKASDFEFVFGVMKILDPRSVVRGDEQESVKRLAPLLGGMTNKIYSIIDGTGELDENTRKSLLRLAGRKLDESRNTYQPFKEERIKTANRRGFEGAEDLFSLPELSSKDLFAQFDIDPAPSSVPGVSGAGVSRLKQIQSLIQQGSLSPGELSALQDEAKKVAAGLGKNTFGVSGSF